jgi:hypothetical protein
LHPYQIGGRKQKSAIDAVMVLTQKMQANWRTKKKTKWVTSAVALDVKNVFGHIGAAQFARVCMDLGLLTELIHWFMSFMSDRTMRFAFDGEVGPLISVNSGTSQGSPISPIIFLIYLQPIFQALGYWPEIEAIAYINDIIIVTGSTCARTNGIRL